MSSSKPGLSPIVPLALAANQRHGGAHGKSAKIKPRDARQALQKAIRHGRDYVSPFFLAGGRRGAGWRLAAQV